MNEDLVITLEIGSGKRNNRRDRRNPAGSTTGGEVSSLVSEKQVTELPLNGRNYAQLALMVPGVSPDQRRGGFCHSRYRA